MVVIEWREKQLKIDPTQEIAVVKDFVVKKAVKTKEHTEGGKAYSNKEELEPGTISFTLGVYRALGMNVQNELASWMSMIEDGERGNLKLFGIDPLGDEVILKSIEASKPVRGKKHFIQCEIKFVFEASKKAPSPPAAASSGRRRSGTKASSTMSGGGALPKTGAAFRAAAAAREGREASSGGNLTGAYGGGGGTATVVSQ